MAVDKNYYHAFCDDIENRDLKLKWKDDFIKHFWPNESVQDRLKIRVALQNCLRGKSLTSFVTLPYNFKDKLEHYFNKIYRDE